MSNVVVNDKVNAVFGGGNNYNKSDIKRRNNRRSKLASGWKLLQTMLFENGLLSRW